MWIRHCNNREVGKMRVRRRDTRIWFMALAVFFAVFLFTFLRQAFSDKDEVEAANLANFDPGYIISDYQMSNFNSMSKAEIQAFLTAKNPCGNTNQANYELLKERYPSISWHFENGHFICLSEELFGDGEVIGEGETAAHIIWQAAQDYQINPQVIIVLLQKEQGLITDDFPNSRQYRSATGYGCPDTAACSEKYYGFKNQVRNAAAMFRTVLNGGWTNYPIGNNYIQYNPNAACGGSIVNVRNLATSALYRYTPYQPNEGALAAGYGTAYCGAYGNRNFYHYFEDWFSGIRVEDGWKEMLYARVMEITEETKAINPIDGTTYEEEVLEVGEKFYFNTKKDVAVGDKKEACLRTEDDSNNKIERCVLISKLADVASVSYSIEIIEPTKLSVVRDTYKYDLKTGKKVQEIPISVYSEISFSGKTKFNGREYYQTTYDNKNGTEYFIPAEDLSGVIFVNFLFPRNMEVKKDAEFVNLGDGSVCRTVKAGYVNKFTTKIDLEDKIYFRTEEDTNNSIACAVLSSELKETSKWDEIEKEKVVFQEFLFPRKMKVKRNVYLTDLTSGTSCEKNYEAGDEIKFVTKISIKNNVYYRSEEETTKDSTCAISSKDVGEI